MHPDSNMPKEEQRSSEHRPCAASIKSAKDKSNCTTLLALRGMTGADDSNRRSSRCSSEKDSGFSDGSDWQQTDAEDQQSNKSLSRVSEHAETSQPGQSQELGQRNTGKPALMAKAHDRPPIYTIKDMELQQQPGIIQRRGPLLWRNNIREINRPGSHHMVLLQQPSLLPANLHLHKPASRKSTGKKINATCLPILNSCPRIAPLPSKESPDKSKSNHETQNLNKRVCTESNSDDATVTTSAPEQHLHKQPKLAVSSSGLSRSSSTDSSLSSSRPTNASSQGSPSTSSLHTTPSLLSAREPRRNGSNSRRSRRFLNTVEILRQSGLLDITLRTKELLHQSSSTQRDIAQLRQHTELLCQTVQTARNPSLNQDDITAWEHLYRVMAESGSYPNLKNQQNLLNPPSPDSATPAESISTSGTNRPLAADSSEVASSCCLLSTLPDQSCAVSRQSRSENARVSGKTSDKVTIMPPDSSTD